MTFEQLSYFIAIVENETYFNAAHFMNISQSSLSKQIMKLEKELGIELFDRSHRSATLTEGGKLFYSDALELIEKYKKTLNRIDNYKKTNEKILHIGVLPIQAQYNLNSLFKEFEKENPEIHISINEVEEENLLNGINQDKYDFIIARENMINPTQFDIYPITEDELVAVLPSNHKLSNHSKLNFTQLSYENFILMNPYTSIYQLCISQIKKSGIVANIVRTARVESILGSVALNEGVSLLPKSNFHIFHHKNLITVQLDPAIKLAVVGAKNKNKEASLALKKFIKFLNNSYTFHTSL